MTDQEKLQIYSAYLPHILKILFEGEENECDLVGLDITSTPLKVISHMGDYGQAYFEFSKPILRPLSDLTEEIEHEGLKFIPIEYFKYDPVDYFEDTDHFEYLHSWLASQDKSHHVMFLPYGLINQLIEWRFNVFNLPEDQYVKVTKEFNPYK